MTVPSVPVFLAVTGLFDVEYRILVACRNAKVYSLKKFVSCVVVFIAHKFVTRNKLKIHF